LWNYIYYYLIQILLLLYSNNMVFSLIYNSDALVHILRCNFFYNKWIPRIYFLEPPLPRTPRNIQKVHASKLGDAPQAPLLHRQKSGHLLRHYIFIASCTMRFSWSVFTFAFSFVLFAAINGWTPTNFFWRRFTHFSFAKNTPFFTLIVQRVFSFSTTVFSFCFLPWFLFRSCFIFASRHILTSGPCWYSSKELF
jgi:hypothetical protein